MLLLQAGRVARSLWTQRFSWIRKRPDRSQGNARCPAREKGRFPPAGAQKPGRGDDEDLNRCGKPRGEAVENPTLDAERWLLGRPLCCGASPRRRRSTWLPMTFRLKTRVDRSRGVTADAAALAGSD